jgi:hypothetical protein
VTAITSASSTRSVLWFTAVRHPAISRANASMTNAVYAVPAPVATKVKSTTHSRPGASGAKSRFTRSPGLCRDGSGTVVRGFFHPPRRTPRSPSLRISRSTVHRATAMPSRFSWSQTFHAPYRSPLSLETRRICFSSQASRTARAGGGRARAA